MNRKQKIHSQIDLLESTFNSNHFKSIELKKILMKEENIFTVWVNIINTRKLKKEERKIKHYVNKMDVILKIANLNLK